MAFTPKGQLVTGGSDGVVRFWDADTGKERGHFQIGKASAETAGHPPTVMAVAASPDGKMLATGLMGTLKSQVQIWEAPRLKW